MAGDLSLWFWDANRLVLQKPSGWEVRSWPDWQLIAARMLLYGITIFLGIGVILEVLRALLPGRAVLEAIPALVIAMVVTVGLAWRCFAGLVVVLCRAGAGLPRG